MRLTPKNELEYRYRKLQVEMAAAGMDAVLMVQNADLFYFTGTVQTGVLYLPVSGKPIFLVRRDFMRARMESAMEHVAPLPSLKLLPGLLADHGCPPPERLGFELDVLPVNLYQRYLSLFPGIKPMDATPLIRRVRMKKTHYEIHIMQDAAGQADKAYRRVAQVIREGMSEVELAAELEHLMRVEGHQGYVRMRAFNGELSCVQVLSGTDAAAPACTNTALGGMGLTPAFGHGASYNRIRRDEPVVVDFANCFDGYLVDQTRIFAIGTVSDRLRRGYEDMLRIEELMMEMAVEGASWGGIYRACLERACAMGYADAFMGTPGGQVSFIGHGLGVELDEYPFIAKGFDEEAMEVGMAFAFEPKLVFPGEGAVGIENSFYLSEQGLKRLTFSNNELVLL